MYLICHVTSHNHLIDWSWRFMVGSSLQYFTALIILVTIDVVVVEMFLICHLTPHDHMFEGFVMFGEHWSSASGDILSNKFVT